MFSFIIFLFAAATFSRAQDPFFRQLADSALLLTHQQVSYDPSYYRIPYPNGDIPAGKGVCTDVLIRAYRMFGIDLQKEVHEDMLVAFDAYPDSWGASHPDSNIDHRRVPNLMTYFARHGTVLPHTTDPSLYLPGDIVCWDLGGGITHIGLVSAIRSADGKRYQVIHNIGAGQVLEDCLFDFRVTGHYRYGGRRSE